jgi:hypothetical protein
MRSIFRIKTGYGVEDAREEFAEWLYKWSDSLDYSSASIEDARTMAEEFLKQENPRRVRYDGL